MGATERWFKVGLDMFLTAGLGLLLSLWLPGKLALLLGFLVAHTLNFLFNGHLWGVLKHYGAISVSNEDYLSYMRGLIGRANQVTAIERVMIIGSLARQEWTPHSDLDMRLLFQSGGLNSLHVCLFVMGERTRALFHRFPLDLYAYNRELILKLAPGESFYVWTKGGNPGG